MDVNVVLRSNYITGIYVPEGKDEPEPREAVYLYIIDGQRVAVPDSFLSDLDARLQRAREYKMVDYSFRVGLLDVRYRELREVIPPIHDPY